MERNEINDVAPTSLAHLIGQRSVVEQVRVALDAAQMDGLPFPSTLCVGPPGTGKSQVAKVIAAEMCSEFHEVLGQAIQSAADFNALMLGAKDHDIVLIDEVHELEKEYQTALFLALDQKRVFLQGGRSGRTPQSIPLADFTLLLATTDEFRVLSPLVQRMRLVLRFQFYTIDELLELTRHAVVPCGGRSMKKCWPPSLVAPVAHPGLPCGCCNRAAVSAAPRARTPSGSPTWSGPVNWSRLMAGV